MELRYIILAVEDLDRAKQFYQQLLQDEPFKEEDQRMVVFTSGGMKIGLYRPAADGIELSSIGENCIPAFGVEDLEAARNHISTLSYIESTQEIDGHRWFTFRDPDGNLLEIHEKHAQ